MQNVIEDLSNENRKLKSLLNSPTNKLTHLGISAIDMNKTPSPKKLISHESHKKGSGSLNQQSVKKLMPRANHESSKSFSIKKNFEESYLSIRGIENLITEISESEKKNENFHGQDFEKNNFVNARDLIQFMQCTASALEGLLDY